MSASPWHETIDDAPAVALAKRLAVVFTGVVAEQMVLPYVPAALHVPGGDVLPVSTDALVPLWTRFLGAARAAIQAQAEADLEQAIGPAPEIVAPKSPDRLWREERGFETE